MNTLIALLIGIFIGTIIGVIIMSMLSFSRNLENDEEIEKLKFQIEVLESDIKKYKKFWDQSRLTDKQTFEMYVWRDGQVNNNE